MKIARAESFLRAPDFGLLAVLLYGPDSGLVRERALDLARGVVLDLTDPFRTVEITANALIADPARLGDEVAAIAMTGGRRVVIVREAGDSVSSLLAEFLSHPPCRPPQAAFVVIEAGPLPPRSTLRNLFESADNAAALACYLDEGAQLGDFIRKVLAEDKVSLEPEALDYLADNLGGDRGVTRRELEKLAIYAGPGGRVTVDDAIACVGDSSELTLDEVGFAVAGGELAALDRAVARVFLEGVMPVSVLRAVSRHFERLRQADAAIEDGSNDESAMAALRPAVFFKDKSRFRAQLRRWSSGRAVTALQRLVETEILCKTTGLPAETICRHALLDIAREPARASK
jgi:DNA polymerase-3 subunit delta